MAPQPHTHIGRVVAHECLCVALSESGLKNVG